MRKIQIRLSIVSVALLQTSAAFSASPYVQGKLCHPAYIEIAGKPEAIIEIEKYAEVRGWKVVCDRKAVGQSTIRLRFPMGTRQDAIESYFQGDQAPRTAKQQMIYQGMKTSAPLCISLP